MSQNLSLLTITAKASGAIAAHRFVSWGGTYPTAGGKICGVARYAAATGEFLSIDVLGTAQLEITGTVAYGDYISAAADGRGDPYASGTAVAHALEAGVAGQIIEVLLIPS